MSQSSAESELSKEIVKLARQGYYVSFIWDDILGAVMIDVRGNGRISRKAVRPETIAQINLDAMAFVLKDMAEELAAWGDVPKFEERKDDDAV